MSSWRRIQKFIKSMNQSLTDKITRQRMQSQSDQQLYASKDI